MEVERADPRQRCPLSQEQETNFEKGSWVMGSALKDLGQKDLDSLVKK